MEEEERGLFVLAVDELPVFEGGTDLFARSDAGTCASSFGMACLFALSEA